MRLSDLLTELEAFIGDDAPGSELDPEVVVTYQPSYPLVSRVESIRYVKGKLHLVCSQCAECSSQELYVDDGTTLHDDVLTSTRVDRVLRVIDGNGSASKSEIMAELDGEDISDALDELERDDRIRLIDGMYIVVDSRIE